MVTRTRLNITLYVHCISRYNVNFIFRFEEGGRKIPRNSIKLQGI